MQRRDKTKTGKPDSAELQYNKTGCRIPTYFRYFQWRRADLGLDEKYWSKAGFETYPLQFFVINRAFRGYINIC